MRKNLIFWIIFLIFASCSSSRKVPQNQLTPEQEQIVRENGGFNPFYVSPENGKVWMPKKPRHLK